MVVDTWAVRAVLLGEADAARLAAAIAASDLCSLPPATFLEISIVAEALGDAAVRRWESFFR